MNEEPRAELIRLVKAMVDVKLALYPDDERFMFSYEFTQGGGARTPNVAALLRAGAGGGAEGDRWTPTS